MGGVTLLALLNGASFANSDVAASVSLTSTTTTTTTMITSKLSPTKTLTTNTSASTSTGSPLTPRRLTQVLWMRKKTASANSEHLLFLHCVYSMFYCKLLNNLAKFLWFLEELELSVMRGHSEFDKVLREGSVRDMSHKIKSSIFCVDS